MKKKYFDWESVFAHIWNNADEDGLWGDDNATLAGEFNVSEDEAHAMLAQFCHRHLIEKLLPGKYAIEGWQEREDSAEEPK